MSILGNRLRIGIVIPSTNTSAQPEMDDLRPQDVTNHISRMIIVDENLTEEPGFNSVIQSMRNTTIPAIEHLKDCKLDRVIIAVSPDAYWYGEDKHQQMLKHFQESSGGVAISMSADAIKMALKELGNITRIGLISPYTSLGNVAVSQFFIDSGYDILTLANLGGQSPSNISEVTLDDLRYAIEITNTSDVQAIIQVGTNVPMAAFANIAEQWIGKPVIANNVALYWHALRSSGIYDQFYGFGKLLSCH